MPREYHLISADSHVLEPPHIWTTYMPKQFHAKAPTVVYRDRDPVAATPPPAPYKVTVIKKSQSTTTGTAQDAGK